MGTRRSSMGRLVGLAFVGGMSALGLLTALSIGWMAWATDEVTTWELGLYGLIIFIGAVIALYEGRK